MGVEELAAKVVTGLTLPASLKQEIIDHTHRDIIENIIFF